LFSVQSKLPVGVAAFIVMNAVSFGLRAQDGADTPGTAKSPRPRIATGAPAKISQRTATIHWQRVPLRDALARLHTLFDDTVFVDRRIDPSMRVSLDIEAGSAEEVVAGIAAGRELGVARLGALVYLGPNGAADQLRAISAARSQEVGRLPAELRASLTQKQPTDWPRLGEPRGLVTSIVEQRGWRLKSADVIPHDLWSAGELPGLTLAEQLTVLLIGFDLTFELRPNDHSIEIVPLKGFIKTSSLNEASKRGASPVNSARAKKDGKHVYTLRVQEQPVGTVLQELSKRLHWAIQIDEESIRAAGKSLEKRVSFSVENADQEHLFQELLRPAGLDFRLEGERVRVFAGRYDEK
jgi:hypothetical protein